MIKKLVWKTLMNLAFVFGGVCLSCGLVIADEGHHHSDKGKSSHAGMMEMHKGSGQGGMRHHSSLSPLSMKTELGLKDDQVKALEPVESNYRKTIIKNRADLRIAMIDLGTLLDQKETDRSAVAKKVDEIGGLQKELMMYRVDTLLKLKNVLTPAQYQQFRDRLKKQMNRGMGGGMHGMGGMMGHGAMGKHGYGKKGHSEGYRHGKDLKDDD